MNTTEENQIVTQKPQRASALAVMAQRFSVDPGKLLETLQKTVFKNANESQLMALVIVSNEYGLNPFTKQIYAFPDKGGGIVPVVSVDGWMHLINSHPQMDGIEFEDHHDETGKLVSITSIIYRKDRSKPTRVTEYLSECRRNTDPWKMEHRMLRHKALIQGGRVAFGLGGIHDEDEAEVIAAKPIFAKVVEPPKRQPRRIADKPQETAPTEQPPPIEQSPITPYSVVAECCREDGVSEDSVLEYLKRNAGVDPGTPTLADIPDEMLEQVRREWAPILDIIRPKEPTGEPIASDSNSLRAAILDRDLDEAQVVTYLVAKHKAGAGCKTLAAVPESGRKWLAENLDAVKNEIANE